MIVSDEEAKAVQEVSKTAGKAIDATQEAGRFLAPFIRRPLEVASGILTDWLECKRFTRQVLLAERMAPFAARVKALLQASGLDVPTRPVPLKIAIPLLEGALLEEDHSLQDRWAALLVNAANADFGAEIHRSYIDILEQLTALEVRVLDVIYDLPFEEADRLGIVTVDLPNTARIWGEGDNVAWNPYPPPEDLLLALGNLDRLGCLKLRATLQHGQQFQMVNPTVLGRCFVNACRVPGAG